MPPSLTALGTCSYNAYVFSEYMETMGIQGTPIYDQSGRTVVYCRWVVTVRDRVLAAAGDTIDSTMETIRTALMAPGGVLVYANKGFGDLSINGASSKKDVLWGPKPQSFDYRLTGRDLAAEITWTFEVAIPQCSGASFSGAIMESVYGVTYGIDRGGYTTRTVSGYLRIPQTKASASSKTLVDNADYYRDRIVPIAPDGFRRVDSHFALDESTCRLNYSITDEPPPGVIEVQASHSVSSQPPSPSSAMWTGTISASYEMARGVSRGIAFNYFKDLCLYRINRTQASGVGKVMFPVAMSLQESEIYGRKGASCSFTYTFTCSAKDLLAGSALFEPVPNSNYLQWRASMAGIFSANGRSYANLAFQSSDDVIVDLCGNNTSIMTAGGVSNLRAVGGADNFITPYPDPDASWIDFQMKLRIEPDDMVVEMKPLPLSPVGAVQQGPNQVNLFTPAPAAAPAGGQIINNIAPPQLPYSGGQNITSPQQRCSPSITVWLSGQAIRAGYPIDAPQLTTIGGVTATQADIEGRSFFETWILRESFGVPIVAAAWRRRYILSQTPTGPIGIPSTPYV